jgi:hypothetical protein
MQFAMLVANCHTPPTVFESVNVIRGEVHKPRNGPKFSVY